MVTALLVAFLAAPAPVTTRYSGVYDEFKHRSQLPNCPAMSEVMPRIRHAQEMWERRGDEVLGRVRRVTAMPDFPSEPITVYLIGCGRGISDPLTIAVYGNGPDGPFIPRTDEELIADITHELFHHVALTADYDPLWEKVTRAFPDASVLTTNHILVAAFETRIYGQAAIARRYWGNPEYLDALTLAMRYGIGVAEPMP